MSFQRVLVANRGEIARRIIKTLRLEGYFSLAVYSVADRDSLHVRDADLSMCIGGPLAADCYLNIEAILSAAKAMQADAIHPGYGFLSENAEFARAVRTAGLVFIGPHPDTIELLGNKQTAKAMAEAAGLPLLPGYGGSGDAKQFLQAAKKMGFPVMIKAAAGGGGRGMRRVNSDNEFLVKWEAARAEALSAFGSDEVFLEKLVARARHIEVQIAGDGKGGCVHLGTRDCSVQRRHQKIIEEAPAPGLSTELERRICEAAVQLGAQAKYENLGTVEFLLDEREQFSFLEVNTRLQVEHPVTEEVTGLDLVALQLRIARGDGLGLKQSDIQICGHAIEVRVCAEDQNSLPQTGRIYSLQIPRRQHIRVDHFLSENYEISPYYDSMLAKVIASGSDRSQALRRVRLALSELVLLGPATNQSYLDAILVSAEFVNQQMHTAMLDGFTMVGPEPLEALALAAVGLLAKRSDSELSLWSNQRNRKFQLRLTIAGNETPVSVVLNDHEFEVTVHAATFRIGHVQWIEGGFSSEINGVRKSIPCFILDAHVYLKTGLNNWKIRDVTFDASRELAAHGSYELFSPMDGKILKVCSQGRVATAEVVVVIEAMKMEHQLKAPFDAVVESLKVKVGQQVKTGQLLARLDSSPHSVKEIS